MGYDVRKQGNPFPENLVRDILRKGSAGEVWDCGMPGDILEAIDYAFASLTRREAQILYGRYRDHMSLAELGNNFGISSDWVRQIETLALRKLRHWFPEESLIFTRGMEAYRQYAEKSGLGETENRSGETLVEDLGLPTGISNALHRAGYRYVSDIEGKSWEELRSVNRIGPKSFRELQEALKKAGFRSV